MRNHDTLPPAREHRNELYALLYQKAFPKDVNRPQPGIYYSTGEEWILHAMITVPPTDVTVVVPAATAEMGHKYYIEPGEVIEVKPWYQYILKDYLKNEGTFKNEGVLVIF